MKSIQPGCGHVEIKRILIELSPPFISAKSWAIADGRTGQIIFGKADTEKREIASLTKIMTALTALHLSYAHHIDLYRTFTKVSETAASIGGTRAMVAEGDRLSLMDLLYGMMLPSGNDAAIAVAEYFGAVLLKQRAKAKSAPGNCKQPVMGTSRNLHLAETYAGCATAENAFVEEMNKTAKELKLGSTSFLNPHGMHIFCNRSTAAELAKLSVVAMADETFREIVRKKLHVAVGYDSAGKEKEFTWENTNKLLGKAGCTGIKTGMTETAGPCLVTSIQSKSANFIIVLLGSKTMDIRWQEIQKLKVWAIERLKVIGQISKKGKRSKRKVLNTFKHI